MDRFSQKVIIILKLRMILQIRITFLQPNFPYTVYPGSFQRGDFTSGTEEDSNEDNLRKWNQLQTYNIPASHEGILVY